MPADKDRSSHPSLEAVLVGWIGGKEGDSLGPGWPAEVLGGFSIQVSTNPSRKTKGTIADTFQPWIELRRGEVFRLVFGYARPTSPPTTCLLGAVIPSPCLSCLLWLTSCVTSCPPRACLSPTHVGGQTLLAHVKRK